MRSLAINRSAAMPRPTPNPCSTPVREHIQEVPQMTIWFSKGMSTVIVVLVLAANATVVWVVLFFLAIQQVENNMLAPRISGHAVGLHPLGAMFALLAGFQLAALLGGLVAVPLAGVLWVLLGAAYRNVVAALSPPGPSDGCCRCRASACLPARSS